MSRVIILCALAAVTIAHGPLPSMPTQGSVWPKPYREQKGNDVYKLAHNRTFVFMAFNNSCALTRNAAFRACDNVKILADMVYNKQDVGNSDLNELPVQWKLYLNLTQPCEAYPHADMDEGYNLTIGPESILTSASVWGIMRGLETWSQLFYISDDYTEVLINSTTIYDYPQYSHRGILVDTSRHYLSMDTMYKLLDGMATNKMNVLHWHMVDDPSFPYQSEKFPELSQKGAYFPSMTYKRRAIKKIVEYGKKLGIRLLLEIDTPAHVTSWGLSHPEIMTQCKESYRRPLNPVKNETYDLLRKLFREVQDMLPERYFHLGGDEVLEECWTEDPTTQQYMKEHQMSTDDLYGLYMNNTMKLLKKGTVPVMWEEAFFNNKTDMTNAVVQAWNSKAEMAEMIKKHIKVIFSTEWYLGYDLSKHFNDYYKFDPRLIAYNATEDHSLDKYIIGGEACMWGEMVDDSNILSRIFPRGSGPAEVLWSVTNGTVPDDLFNRMEEHSCRMRRRGYPAEPPSGPGFCVTPKNIIIKPKHKPNPYHRDRKASRSGFTRYIVIHPNRTKTPL
ncbi:beta-hexosaminidase subunit beta-like [Pectinophora gossypiella]|uniref:beta-hexosaminidase subunit beta-like n=1 Tax=Pectinophora gossypiella TaxID=13191 RepID=UPI00214EF8D2|nr:beta-hexosaminidase subunit beta-like [Pectinophora gossypiella]